MKALLLIALLPLSSLARNGNDGPSAMPKPPSSLLAEFAQACGFMCPNGDWRAVRILSNGLVLKASGQHGKPESWQNLAQLDPGLVETIAEEIRTMEIAELEDSAAGTPQCMDAPTSSFLVYRNGKPEKIRQLAGCHSFELPSRQGSRIIQLLEGFSSF